MNNINMYRDPRYKEIIKRRILKKLTSYDSIRVINVFYYDDNKLVLLPYSQAIKRILSYDFPVYKSVKDVYSLISEIKNIYNKNGDHIYWLLSSYDGSKWWIEIEILDLDMFLFDEYKKEKYQFIIIDRKNNFVMDSDLIEGDQYQIRILRIES